jgi:hypothetical protein
MSQGKIDQDAFEALLKRILARNHQVLAIMKKVEEMPVPEGKTKLDLLAEEIEAAGLNEVFNENS